MRKWVVRRLIKKAKANIHAGGLRVSYYQPGTMEHEKGKLFLAWGEVYLGLAWAIEGT